VPLDQTARGAPFGLYDTGLILALDLSSTVGWALGDRPETLRWGQWLLPVTGGEGARGAGFAERLVPMLEEHRPRRMVIEAPLPPMAQTNTHSARQQYGLNWQAHYEAWHSSCATSEIDALTVRNEVMGSHRPASKDRIKREVVAFCRRRGFRVTSHHQADAVLLWLCLYRRLTGVPICAGPLWREVA